MYSDGSIACMICILVNACVDVCYSVMIVVVDGVRDVDICIDLIRFVD